MSRQSRHGRFDVWVEVDGRRAQQYGEGVNGRTSTCFIESKGAAEITVYVQEHKSMTTASARADVYMEGVHVGKAVLSPAKGPSHFIGSWLDKNSVRPFVFTTAKRRSNLRVNLDEMQDAGKIIVKISEVVVLSDESEEIGQPPPPLKEWQAPPVVEDDAEIGRHSIILSRSIRWRRYEPQYDMLKTQPFDSCNPQPIATFEFVYGSKEFIAMRCLEEFASSGSHVISREGTKLIPVSGAPSGSGPSRKRVRANSASNGEASVRRDANTRCTRCSEAEVACVPNGGSSRTCQRCKSRKQSCDLPEILMLSTENRRPINHTQINGPAPRGIIKTYGKNARDEPGPSSAQKAFVRFSSTESHSISQTQQSRDVDYEIDADSDPAMSPSPEVTALEHLRRQASPTLTDDLEDVRRQTNGTDKRTFETVNKVNGKARASGSGSAKSNDMDVDVESPPAPTEAGFNARHANEVLNAIRAFSDELMELMAQGGQRGIVADVAGELVKNCDSSSRRLQASILQDRIARRSEAS